jgi:hypothetical protein
MRTRSSLHLLERLQRGPRTGGWLVAHRRAPDVEEKLIVEMTGSPAAT